jgi:hypothetical protein
MYGHIIAVGSPSAAFFVLLQVFGKYVLLNLFLAILLENFDDIEAPGVSYFNYLFIYRRNLLLINWRKSL